MKLLGICVELELEFKGGDSVMDVFDGIMVFIPLGMRNMF